MIETIKQYILKHKGAILALFVFALIFLYIGRITNKQPDIFIVNDSIQVLQNKNKEYYSRIASYIVSEKELKEANSQLYTEIKKLKDKPISISSVTTTIQYIDSLHTVLISPSKRDYIMSWSKDTLFSKGNAIKIEGNTELKVDSLFTPISYKSYLKSLEISSKLYFIQTEKKGKIYLNARSDFPNLKFTEMENYIVNPLPSKRKRVGISAFTGIDYRGKLTVGVGITYSIFQF